MKRLFYLFSAFVVFAAIPLAQKAIAKTKDTAPIEVVVAVICRDIIDRKPVDIGNNFDSTVEKLYCFTKIVGARSTTEITHIWYLGNTERARVTLPVKSSMWRTYSSKKIQAHEIGYWHVDIVGPDGQILRKVQFNINP